MYEELKVERDKKDTVIQTQGAELQKQKIDLLRLQNSNNNLSTAANINMEKLNHELNINETLHKEKEGVEMKLTDSMAIIKNLQEQVAAQNDELKKAEGSKNYYLDKISKLESGEIITQQTIDIIMNDFFTLEAWRNAQIDNFISSGNFFIYT